MGFVFPFSLRSECNQLVVDATQSLPRSLQILWLSSVFSLRGNLGCSRCLNVCLFKGTLKQERETTIWNKDEGSILTPSNTLECYQLQLLNPSDAFFLAQFRGKPKGHPLSARRNSDAPRDEAHHGGVLRPPELGVQASAWPRGDAGGGSGR